MHNRFTAALLLVAVALLSPVLAPGAAAGQTAETPAPLYVTPNDFGLAPGIAVPAARPSAVAVRPAAPVPTVAVLPPTVGSAEIAAYDRVPIVVEQSRTPTAPRGPEFTNTADPYGTVPVVVNTGNTSTPIQTTLGTLGAVSAARGGGTPEITTTPLPASRMPVAVPQYAPSPAQIVAPAVSPATRPVVAAPVYGTSPTTAQEQAIVAAVSEAVAAAALTPGTTVTIPVTINAPITVANAEEAEAAMRAIRSGQSQETSGAITIDVPVTISPTGEPIVAPFVVPIQMPAYVQNIPAAPAPVPAPVETYPAVNPYANPYAAVPPAVQPYAPSAPTQPVFDIQQVLANLDPQQAQYLLQNPLAYLEYQRQFAQSGQYLSTLQTTTPYGTYDPARAGGLPLGSLPAEYRPMAATPGETSEFLDFTQTPTGAINLVTPAQVKAAIAHRVPMIILDVRGELVRDVEGHLTGDIGVPFEPRATFPQRVAQVIPSHDIPVIVYCRDGIWSSQAAAVLLEMGYRPFLMGAYRLWFG